jgi:hypothetical protein
VPDLFLPVSRHGKNGFYIELKKAGGNPTESQWDWLTYLYRAGYKCAICNDPETAVSLVTEYMEGSRE